MKLSVAVLLALSLHLVKASPAPQLQTILNGLGDLDLAGLSEDLRDEITHGLGHTTHQAGRIIHDSKERVTKWFDGGKEFIQKHGLVYELVSLPTFPDHQLRVTDPDICDPKVKQHSGYLDITYGKHLFFWFFEARNAPKDAPLTLWLNGGPGCSSMTGALFENGPCRVSDGGETLTGFKQSWTAHSNMIFLDQPINVGYSYSSDGSTVNTTPVAAEDVYAFLELFLTRYPEYADAPFHLAAESYGGTYAPHIASIIYKKNHDLKYDSTPGPKHINLASVILANGQTDPLTQFPTVPEYACNGPYPLYDDPEGPQCTALRSKIPTCQRLINACYNFHSKLVCLPAAAYCNSQIFGTLQQTGANLYDVRKKCDRKAGPLCYEEFTWINKYLNVPEVKAKLGVPSQVTFESCNMEVNQAFFSQGDGVKDSSVLLPELLDAGIRLLVYAGDADAMCNFMGNEAWLEKLPHKLHDEFAKAKHEPWVTLESGTVAGEVRSAGGDGFTAGNVTFVRIYKAGHMVPFDQPDAALDLFTRWIMDIPLTLNVTETVAAVSRPFGGI